MRLYSPVLSRIAHERLEIMQKRPPHTEQQNVMRHSQFFELGLAQLGFDKILDQVEALARDTDPATWRRTAAQLGIDSMALDVLDGVRTAYPYYFCDPSQLVKTPCLVAYYRNLAMLSAQTMQAIGLETANHEAGQPLSPDKAQQLALYLNGTISTFLVTNPSLITSRRHIEMVFSNLGDSIGDAWQNEIGD